MTIDQTPEGRSPPLVINPTEEQLKRVAMFRGDENEELREFDWTLIGTRTKRIDIPLDQPALLRIFIPDQLRALATFMETTMQRDDLALRSQLMEIGMVVRQTSRRIEHSIRPSGE